MEANKVRKISPTGVIWLRSRRLGLESVGWSVGLEVGKGGRVEEASGVNRAMVVKRGVREKEFVERKVSRWVREIDRKRGEEKMKEEEGEKE